MKNLINKYQVPVTGWEWQHIGEGSEWEWEWDEEVEELRAIRSFDRYFDNPINNLPQRSRKGSFSRRDYRHWDEHMKRAEAIIENSVGENISVIRRKVAAELKFTRAHEGNISKFMSWSLVTYEMENGKKYFKDMNGRYSGNYHLYRRGVVHVDEEGILRKYYGKRTKKERKDARKNYETITWKRKEYKQRRLDKQRISHFYVKMINSPELARYYEKILSVYAKLNVMEEAAHKEKPKKEKDKYKGMYQWEVYVWRKAREEFTSSRRKERDRIRQNLDDMMQGDFSDYYNSKEYLYTLYKECHHFAQP